MKTAGQRYSRYISVPSGEGVRVDHTIIINRPVEDVYSFWNRFENLPRFMRHLESVVVQDDLHSHWTVKLGGKTIEWDAEIIERRENEMISWRSTPGADMDNAGSVWFTRVPSGHGTILRVELKYVPPAGKTGTALAKLFRRDPDSELGEDLARLKALLETGTLPQDGYGRAVRRRVASAARATDDYVHENT